MILKPWHLFAKSNQQLNELLNLYAHPNCADFRYRDEVLTHRMVRSALWHARLKHRTWLIKLLWGAGKRAARPAVAWCRKQMHRVRKIALREQAIQEAEKHAENKESEKAGEEDRVDPGFRSSTT